MTPSLSRLFIPIQEVLVFLEGPGDPRTTLGGNSHLICSFYFQMRRLKPRRSGGLCRVMLAVAVDRRSPKPRSTDFQDTSQVCRENRKKTHSEVRPPLLTKGNSQPLPFKDLFYCLNEYMSVCGCVHISVGGRRGRGRVSDPLELEVQAAISCLCG